MNGEFFSRHFSLEKVSEGIYAAIAKEGGGSVGNAGFIDLGDQTIVFDTFNTQQAAEELKSIATKITNRPVTFVINSHWHGDHIRGNQVFQDSTIISSQLTYEKIKDLQPTRIRQQIDNIQDLTNYIHSLKAQMRKTNDIKLAQKISFLSEVETSLPTLELVLPKQTFKEEITFHGTKRSAKLFTWGGGHSYCDAVLFIPNEKVIFMGDLLFVNSHPSFFEESNPEQWIQILKKVGSLDFQKAVPGHGPIGTKKDLLEVSDYIAEMIQIAITANLEEILIPFKYQNWTSPEIYQQNFQSLKELYS
ncbi:MBL fold metallo-hydrolase [Neobacillus vireti]|uniref:Beta-lactamase n=1 Tax=Neobacillus vireti LMG 21834 TaxID=1131730 RepID=A0AB94IMT3_9BACI|nr:MBL fold metallo-hydrolase [Neobacillus vireti]ETI68330.1 beta-lactamase [Neobacillus vireti LMG 21834]KLT16289.1 Second ring cyclase [Neobacillus vireti]